MERKNLVFLFLIILVGAILRFALLTWNPPSLNWDEISHGYNAYSILKTGMDQWGVKFPIFNFRAYGDYPTTLNLYLTIPFVALWGLTAFAIRFPHALLGTLTIISAYFLSLGVTKRKDLSLLTAFLVAASPWYVFTSRFVLQSNLSIFLLTTAMAVFFNRAKSRLFLPISFLLLTLTLFSYHTTRIFSPVFLIGMMFIYRDEIKNWLVYVFVAFFIGLSAYILISPSATVRGNLLFIIDQAVINKIDQERAVSHFSPVFTKLIYNRPVYFVTEFGKNYVSYFSPQFLFLNGGTQYQFSVPGKGLLNPVGLPFFYIGIIILILKAIKEKDSRVILLWLILSPVPASLTNEMYTVIRATTMLPLTEILVATGFFWFLGRIKENLHGVIICGFLVIFYVFAENYYLNYFLSYRTNYSWSWQYGYEQVVNFAATNYQNYDKIIVTKKYGEPHEYFLFFMKYDPAKYINDPTKIAFFQSNWWWVDHFDKFWFVNDWQVKDLITESKVKIDCARIKCLLITSPGNAPARWFKIDTINFLDRSVAFEIYSNVQK